MSGSGHNWDPTWSNCTNCGLSLSVAHQYAQAGMSVSCTAAQQSAPAAPVPVPTSRIGGRAVNGHDFFLNFHKTTAKCTLCEALVPRYMVEPTNGTRYHQYIDPCAGPPTGKLALAQQLLGAPLVTSLQHANQLIGSQVFLDTKWDENAGKPYVAPKCECGAAAVGTKDFAVGHAGYCPVGSKT